MCFLLCSVSLVRSVNSAPYVSLPPTHTQTHTTQDKTNKSGKNINADIDAFMKEMEGLV